MTEDLVLPLAALTIISLLAALNAWFRQWYSSAHALNVIPLALLSALSLFAVATHTAGHVTWGAMAVLVTLIALVVLCVVAAMRSARWLTVFWLTVMVNLGLIGGLVYLRFYFRIF